MAGASFLAEAVANALPARGPGVPAWPFFIRVHQSNQWLNLFSAFLRGGRTVCHSQECWSKSEGVEGPASSVEGADGERFASFDLQSFGFLAQSARQSCAIRHQLSEIRPRPKAYQLSAIGRRPDILSFSRMLE
jgi:hypothetical protein